jgi:SpoVK/Ycf46/Vps4 family AAA+-type ATPase
LPNVIEREAIFRVHLTRVRPDRVKQGDFDLKLLAEQSKNFSGAEIEQVVFDAMQNAFSAGVEFSQQDLLGAIAGCVPLAQIAEAQIDDLKTWAIRSGAKSASSQYSEVYQPSVITLEVDNN